MNEKQKDREKKIRLISFEDKLLAEIINKCNISCINGRQYIDGLESNDFINAIRKVKGEYGIQE